VAILNADDDRVAAMARDASARVITYGLQPGADLVGRDVTVTPEGTSLTIRWSDVEAQVHIPYVGPQHANTAMAAVAVGLLHGVPLPDMRARLASLEPLPGRTRLLPAVRGASLLDDSYSSVPASALAALETLRLLSASRRLVLLGDMTDLGDMTAEGHRRVGRLAAQVADVLITKGLHGRGRPARDSG
jgi:UDP-N-acetylmuramoyl-tripeptide--D-alanyl-D-alanine ligase